MAHERAGGYVGYYAQLRREMGDQLVAVDAVDTASLKPGTHEVTVNDMRYAAGRGSRGQVRIILVGSAGRRHAHVCPRDEWPFTVGDRLTIVLQTCGTTHVARNPAGAYVVVAATTGGGRLVDGSGGVVSGPHATLDAARTAAGDELKQVVLAEADYSIPF